MDTDKSKRTYLYSSVPHLWLLFFCLYLLALSTGCQTSTPHYEASPNFSERTLTLQQFDTRIQIILPAADQWKSDRPTRLIIYALPNGNSIEWTVGCVRTPGLDWHYDIQHIGAQTRRLREVNNRENIVIAYLEADKKSWPAWRASHPKANEDIRELIEFVTTQIPGMVDGVTLSGHSGGGSLVSGFIEGGDSIPAIIDRIVYLDANYSYDDDKHAGKLLKWLDDSKLNRFIILCYDDRNIELNGKKVVSDTGGTFRATHRFLDRFSRDMKFDAGILSDFETQVARNGQVRALIHPNPQNKILHTTMVGEMSGFLYSMCVETPEEKKWGELQGEKTWTKWVQPAPATPQVGAAAPATQPATLIKGDTTLYIKGRVPFNSLAIPPRAPDATDGGAFMNSIAALSREQRETAIGKEFLCGNVPDFLRHFKAIKVKTMCVDGIERTIEYQVSPDYLAIGSDADFIRVPMNPYTAQAIADAFGCSLITKKMVDDIDANATVRLEPKPLTEAREAVTTFIQHNQIIEEQRKGKPLGEIICGIKKDVVLTNRLLEKPSRVAIYGWRKLDNSPIQPLTIVHIDWYVDYSHGIRLVQREVKVDGKVMMIEDVMKDPHLHVLVNDEGALKLTRYPDHE